MTGLQMAAVAVGGAVGAVSRVLVTHLMAVVAGHRFPYGTLAVNVLGSFLLGLVLTLGASRARLTTPVIALLGSGFCGGFTTFSTYSVETVEALTIRTTASGLSIVVLNNVLALAAAGLGLYVGRRL